MPDLGSLTGWPLVVVIALLFLRDEAVARRTARELAAHREEMERGAVIVRQGDGQGLSGLRSGAVDRRRLPRRRP